jgi:hypothetical protein
MTIGWNKATALAMGAITFTCLACATEGGLWDADNARPGTAESMPEGTRFQCGACGAMHEVVADGTVLV